MAPSRLSDRRIQPRRDDSDEEYVSEENETSKVSGLDNSDSETDSESGPDNGTERDEDTEGTEDDSATERSENGAEDLKDISFGALAKAQEAFAPPSVSRKRKLESQDSKSDNATTFHTTDNPHPTRDSISKKPKQDLSSRSSKHAPQVLSSRHPVTRARTIFEPPATQKSRDPRFDPTITSRTLNSNAVAAASKAYSFLNDYQAAEILALKSEIKKSQTSNPDHAAELKKKVMSMESRLRNAEVQSKEREILQKHKAQEKQAIKEGRKNRPYFLKKSDVKKEIEQDRVEGLNKRQKDKMEKRKRMREKRKEARDMPWARRMG